MNHLLEMRHITAGYGQSQVIHDVNLAIAPGEVVCLLGPNGAGKSTVLKALFQLATLHEGELVYKQETITKHKTFQLLELGIGFVPQGRINFPRMTIRENLEMGAFLMNDKVLVRQRLDFVLEQFPKLHELIDTRAGSLSGGEGQMLAIARALMMNPSLLLLDEPSLGLAPKAVEDIFQNLEGLVRSGMTILMVEQNVHLALQISGRGYLLAGGRIVFEGDVEELRDPDRMRDLYLGDKERPPER